MTKMGSALDAIYVERRYEVSWLQALATTMVITAYQLSKLLVTSDQGYLRWTLDTSIDIELTVSKS